MGVNPMSAHNSRYYVPEPSGWPIMGCIALFTLGYGGANWLHGVSFGPWLVLIGFIILWGMMVGWFGRVIYESQHQYYNQLVDRSFRWGMCWFIVSEVCFFAIFFGALFYARAITVPSLGGAGEHVLSHLILWPNFSADWPVLVPPDHDSFQIIEESMTAWGLATINTLILLSSGVTITFAHHALLKSKRTALIVGLLLTIVLGVTFLFLQAHEYIDAYLNKGLTLRSGIYGTTFFLLTGFHGLHVTIGSIMLIVIALRAMLGHFTPDKHFAFLAVAWYWHFVDVVWLALFFFVYWM